MIRVLFEFTDGRTVEGFPNTTGQILRAVDDLHNGNPDTLLTFETLPGAVYRTGDIHRITIDH